MSNLELKPISCLDVDWLDKTEYKSLSIENRKALIRDSEKGLCKGEFFRFFIVIYEGEKIGVINMCGHGKDTVSVAPEILQEYRLRGFGEKSLKEAYLIAKKTGFKELTAGIREDNLASINLHLKMGFRFIKNHVSKNGVKLKIYSKQL